MPDTSSSEDTWKISTDLSRRRIVAGAVTDRCGRDLARLRTVNRQEPKHAG
jgi:hypothetical protein